MVIEYTNILLFEALEGMGNPQDFEMDDVKRKVESLDTEIKTLAHEMRESNKEQREQNKLTQKILSKIDVRDERFNHMQQNIDRIEGTQSEQGGTIKEVRDGQKRNTWVIGVFIAVSMLVGGAFIRYLFSLIPS